MFDPVPTNLLGRLSTNITLPYSRVRRLGIVRAIPSDGSSGRLARGIDLFGMSSTRVGGTTEQTHLALVLLPFISTASASTLAPAGLLGGELLTTAAVRRYYFARGCFRGPPFSANPALSQSISRNMILTHLNRVESVRVMAWLIP